MEDGKNVSTVIASCSRHESMTPTDDHGTSHISPFAFGRLRSRDSRHTRSHFISKDIISEYNAYSFTFTFEGQETSQQNSGAQGYNNGIDNGQICMHSSTHIKGESRKQDDHSTKVITSTPIQGTISPEAKD